ncbi:hypothetical protein [Streptomyces sp. S1D4-20]|uniref:hypothetical protein n=1 Tax=Streptomyces sp. S1D4-20 TaxID=2594462 RepID=UPI0011647272|nr:hypothetical protein [Streptomyces sp. S1D4-20]QDN54265.1 hypothetical protein FNV67_01490 [Streptomyces sp. S1D4-20]
MAVVPLHVLPAVLAVCGITMGLAIVCGGRQLARCWHQHPAEASHAAPAPKLSAPMSTFARATNHGRTAEPA